MTTGRLGPFRRRYSVVGHYQMPGLDPNMILSKWPGWISCVGYQPRDRQLDGSVLVHYTDDFRFTRAWNKPELYVQQLQRSGAVGAVEPDHSVYVDDPWPEQMHAIFRTRWCGRHWQAAGVRIVPSLTWTTPDSVLWTCAGIPEEPAMVAVEARPSYIQRSEYREGLLAALELVRPRRLLCYGALPSWLPRWLDDVRWCRPWSPSWRMKGVAGLLERPHSALSSSTTSVTS